MSSNAFGYLQDIFFPNDLAIAACSGHGIALGTFLICCCDYRIGVKGDFMLGANEMRTNMVIPTPILELIKFRVNNFYKYRAVLGAEMYTLEQANEAGLMDEVVNAKDLMNVAMEKAKDLAKHGPSKLYLNKRTFYCRSYD